MASFRWPVSGGQAPPTEIYTDAEGGAVLHLENYKSYLIRTDKEGGFEGREMCLPIRSSWDRSRYVHFQVRLDSRKQITISQPSVARSVRASHRLIAGDFAGVYVDALNRAYVVEASDDERGIMVERPDGDRIIRRKCVGVKRELVSLNGTTLGKREPLTGNRLPATDYWQPLSAPRMHLQMRVALQRGDGDKDLARR